MHLWIFNHCSTRRSDVLHHLILRLSARTYSGLVGKADYPLVKFIPTFWCGWNLPSLGLFIFTRCITTPCIFACSGLSAVSDLEIDLRDLIRSWMSFYFSMSQIFSEIFLKWSENLSNFPAWSGLIIFFRPIHWSSWRSPLSLLGWSFYPLLSGGFPMAISCTKRSPVFLGIQNYRRDCSTLARNVLESLLPEFLFHSSVTKKVSWYISPDLRLDYFGRGLSSSFCRGGEN